MSGKTQTQGANNSSAAEWVRRNSLEFGELPARWKGIVEEAEVSIGGQLQFDTP